MADCQELDCLRQRRQQSLSGPLLCAMGKHQHRAPVCEHFDRWRPALGTRIKHARLIPRHRRPVCRAAKRHGHHELGPEIVKKAQWRLNVFDFYFQLSQPPWVRFADRAKLGSKRHLICDGRGVPLAIQLTGANRNDSQEALALVDAIPLLQGERGRPRYRPDCVMGDRGYDAEAIRQGLRISWDQALARQAKHRTR
jgi:hypothetical protein